MSKHKQVQRVTPIPSSEELKTAGIRELTAEELLEVNGGRNVEGAYKSYSSSRSSGRSSGRSSSSSSSSKTSSSSGRGSYSKTSSSSGSTSYLKTSSSSGSSSKTSSSSGGYTSSKTNRSTASIASGSANRPYSGNSNTSSNSYTRSNNSSSGSVSSKPSVSSGSTTYPKPAAHTASTAFWATNHASSGSTGRSVSSYTSGTGSGSSVKSYASSSSGSSTSSSYSSSGSSTSSHYSSSSSSGSGTSAKANNSTASIASGSANRPYSGNSKSSTSGTSGYSSGNGTGLLQTKSADTPPQQTKVPNKAAPPIVQQAAQQEENLKHVQQGNSGEGKEQSNKSLVNNIKNTVTESSEKLSQQEIEKAPPTPLSKCFNGGSQVVGGNIVYNDNNKTFSDTKRGAIKDKTKIVIKRSRGHTKGHYLSTLNVEVQSSDNTSVNLFSNPVQSWADKDKELGDNNFTLLAGTYKGKLFSKSPSGAYEEPITLINAALNVFKEYGFLIHANEKTDGTKWKNTGSSEGCQILQGQMKTYRIFTQALKSAGFLFNDKDTIDVQIKDPVGFYTTEYGKEISLNKGGTIPW